MFGGVIRRTGCLSNSRNVARKTSKGLVSLLGGSFENCAIRGDAAVDGIPEVIAFKHDESSLAECTPCSPRVVQLRVLENQQLVNRIMRERGSKVIVRNGDWPIAAEWRSQPRCIDLSRLEKCLRPGGRVLRECVWRGKQWRLICVCEDRFVDPAALNTALVGQDRFTRLPQCLPSGDRCNRQGNDCKNEECPTD